MLLDLIIGITDPQFFQNYRILQILSRNLVEILKVLFDAEEYIRTLCVWKRLDEAHPIPPDTMPEVTRMIACDLPRTLYFCHFQVATSIRFIRVYAK